VKNSDEKSIIVKTHDIASKWLFVNLASLVLLLMSFDVIFARTRWLKPVSHGLNVSLRATQWKASFAHRLYFPENIPNTANVINATKHMLIITST